MGRQRDSRGVTLAGTEARDGGESPGLVTRVRRGDPEAVGEFFERFGPLVRAHFRRKIGRSMRRLVDSEDLLSTIARRLCQRVMGRGVRATDTRQFWALVYRIGNDALVDRVRIVSRLRALEASDSPFVRGLQERLVVLEDGSDAEFNEELEAMLERLESPVDRELLMRWLHGETLAEAGEALGLSAPAARKRWQRLRAQIQRMWEERGRA